MSRGELEQEIYNRINNALLDEWESIILYGNKYTRIDFKDIMKEAIKNYSRGLKTNYCKKGIKVEKYLKENL